jgi:hypothetical protein
VTVTSVAEFTGSVALSVTPPSKTTAKFTPSSILFTGSGAKSSTLAVTTAKAGPRGTYTLTIKGTSGPLSVSTTVQLTIK